MAFSSGRLFRGTSCGKWSLVEGCVHYKERNPLFHSELKNVSYTISKILIVVPTNVGAISSTGARVGENGFWRSLGSLMYRVSLSRVY